MNSRERFVAFLDGRPVDRPLVMPITMMFASSRIGVPYGRYALEYNVLADAQIRTAEEFGFDHVSAITETREARDCGAAIRYFDDQPYAIDEGQARLAEKRDLQTLHAPDPHQGEAMSDRLRGIALLKERAGTEKVIEGWVEGPCGAAADLRGINTLMIDFYDDPGFVRDLFDFVLDLALRFGKAQYDAGADLIGIGDPAASLIGPRLYEQFVYPYEKRLVDGLHEIGLRVRLHICGNTRRILPALSRLGCDINDIDSAVPLPDARESFGTGAVLLGGIDPVRTLQNGTPDEVGNAVEECWRAAGPRYIIGAGCEVPPGTPAENLHTFAAQAARLR
ncbi:MAG: uroporphyrinogen decarboxylase family protein [Bryobacteraceae bacterium]